MQNIYIPNSLLVTESFINQVMNALIKGNPISKFHREFLIEVLQHFSINQRTSIQELQLSISEETRCLSKETRGCCLRVLVANKKSLIEAGKESTSDIIFYRNGYITDDFRTFLGVNSFLAPINKSSNYVVRGIVDPEQFYILLSQSFPGVKEKNILCYSTDFPIDE